MDDNYFSSLELKNNEVQVFKALLEIGPQTVGKLAPKIGLPRPSLYGILSNLKEKGMVGESQKNGLKFFFAEKKEKIKLIYDEKINKIKLDQDKMELFYKNFGIKGNSYETKFQVYDSPETLKQALWSMTIHHDLESVAYWPIKNMVELLSPEFFKEFNKERIKQKIYTRAIWPERLKVDIKDYPYLGVGNDHLREIRIAPADISFSMGYWLFANQAIFISSKKELFGFTITSKELVEMLCSQFEIIWNLSTKINFKD